jgi:peptidyl-prolyl cis-trans isomerase C
MKVPMMLGVFVALALGAGPARAELVASVGSEKIDDVELDAKIAAQERQAKRQLSADERQGVLKALINQRLLVMEAKDEGLEKKDEVKRAVDDARREILSNLVFDQEVGSKVQVGDDEVKRFFDSNPQLFELRKVSQILVAPAAAGTAGAEKKAKGLLAKVAANPKSFSPLAKAESDDTVSKAKGGDLGELRRGMMVKELEQAVFSAKPGSIVGPVMTQFGFHILYVRSSRQQSFDEAKDEIAREMGRARSEALQKKLLEALAQKYKVSINKDK